MNFAFVFIFTEKSGFKFFIGWTQSAVLGVGHMKTGTGSLDQGQGRELAHRLGLDLSKAALPTAGRLGRGRRPTDGVLKGGLH